MEFFGCGYIILTKLSVWVDSFVYVRKKKISSMKNLALFIWGVLFFTGTAGARTVTGEVVCGSKGLSKVIVTDGESFTTTVEVRNLFILPRV